MKKTSVTSEPFVSHSLLSHLLSPTVSLAFLMSPDTCTESAIRSLSLPILKCVVGYSFTLSEILDPFFLVSEVPAHVAQFDCYFINTFQLGGGGGTSYSGVYGETPPEKGDFLSLQHSERLEKFLS